jgi:hypothetical protein
MKEIVAEEKESSNVNAAPIFEFNQLCYLLLWNLHRLKGLSAKKHTLACPYLKIIDVVNCPNLSLYRTLSTRRRSNTEDDKHSVSTQQPLFIVEQVCISYKFTLKQLDNNFVKFLTLSN